MFTSVCLQFERELKWKLRTNNQCLIIISQHVCRLVFIPLSVYCGRLILACVCYAAAITGWCVLILNFCPSYFFFPFLVYLLLKYFSIYFLQHYPKQWNSLVENIPLSCFICNIIVFIFIFFPRQGECWCLLTQLLLSVKPAITAMSISTLNIA